MDLNGRGALINGRFYTVNDPGKGSVRLVSAETELTATRLEAMQAVIAYQDRMLQAHKEGA
jgi:hypothetical protein